MLINRLTYKMETHLEQKEEKKIENIHGMKYEIKMETILGKLMKHFHIVAYFFDPATATQESLEGIKHYYDNFAITLPCPKCQNHYKNYLRNNPVDINNLFQWTIDLHNDINRQEDKKEVHKIEALIGLMKSLVLDNSDIIETVNSEIMTHLLMVSWMFPSRIATAQQLNQITTYFQNFGFIFPIKTDQDHYTNYITQHPIDTSNLFQWSIDLYNHINQLLDKPTVTKDEALVRLVRTLVSNITEFDQKLAEWKQNTDVKNGGGQDDLDLNSDDELSTTTIIVVLSLTFIVLSILFYFGWKYHDTKLSIFQINKK